MFLTSENPAYLRPWRSCSQEERHSHMPVSSTYIFQTFLRFPVVLPAHPRGRFISEMPRGNFFKFGTNVHLDSRIKLLDFGGQRSKIKVTVTSRPSRSRVLDISGGNFITSGTNVHLHSRMN